MCKIHVYSGTEITYFNAIKARLQPRVEQNDMNDEKYIESFWKAQVNYNSNNILLMVLKDFPIDVTPANLKTDRPNFFKDLST